MSNDQRKLKKKLEKAGALVSVNKAGEVKAIQFVGKRTEDKHLELLPDATELEKLIISYTNITDDGLVHLSSLKKLRILSLFRNSIGDAGMVHLEHLTALEQLNLEETGLSDRGIPKLCNLKNLERISMDHESVSQKGEDMLREAIPECQIYR